MQANSLPDTSSWDGATLLSHLGVLVAQGDEAATFLHSQVSQDMLHQGTEKTTLGAYCSPKGRMLASFLSVRPQADTFWLLMDQSVLPATLKRLTMFVLRAKVKLSDGAGALRVVGLLGGTARAVIGEHAPGTVWVHDDTGGTLVRLPDVCGVPRCLWMGAQERADTWVSKANTLAQWRWLEVMSGVARIEAPVSDQLVPQMVNYEVVGGVNFSKGCYPGQEVVARSQYRGTLKRRAFVVHADQALASGNEVYAESDPGQPAGVIVNAVENPGGGWSGLAELKLNAVESVLHVGAVDGPALRMGQLPYELPAADADA
ncbi:MAG: folate-binding protein YgfZ [Burkholderiales bacterium]|nr:folate-binding protein YgfZ [Burkholderiales bacterium]